MAENEPKSEGELMMLAAGRLQALGAMSNALAGELMAARMMPTVDFRERILKSIEANVDAREQSHLAVVELIERWRGEAAMSAAANDGAPHAAR